MGRLQPAAVLFDLDGTLIDTYHLYLECYRRAMAPYLGRTPADEEFIARRPSSERRFLAEWIGEENAEACHAAMLENYRALHGVLGEGLYDGVREMLAALRAAGIPLGIVTGKGRTAWRTTEEELELDRFAVVVTDDDVSHPKPHPQGLLAALEALGAEPAKSLYVGDSAGDLSAGRNAGMRVAAALWPKTAPGEREHFLEEIRPFSPDWAFERPADLSRAFARGC